MKERLIVDETSVYELDEECLQNRQVQESVREKENQNKKKEEPAL